MNSPVEPLKQLFNQAYTAYSDGDSKKALTTAYLILQQDAGNGDAYQIASMSEANLGDLKAALVLQHEAIHRQPTNPQFFYNLGVLQQQNSQNEGAMLSYQVCLRLDPNHADALWNYGDLLRLNEHFKQAIVCFERLIELNKPYTGLQHRLAVSYHGIGRDRAAARCFEAALSTPDRDNQITHWEYSHVLLAQGQMRAGWQAYEYRYRIPGDGCIAVHPFEYPRWQGESLAGKTLLIHGEQGIGDELMFASIIPALLGEGARLVIACHPALCRLFQTSFPQCTVVPHAPVSNVARVDHYEPIDYEVPICSLAYFRGPFDTQQPTAAPYLHADPSQINYFANRLVQLGAPHRKRLVGIMWSANPATGSDWGQRRGLQKSVPIEQLALLASQSEEIQFVSLQNRDSGLQAAHAPGLNLLDLHQELLDFADTAALAANMDVIISVDTSVAHLCGGMGKPVWILLKHHPDWRWLSEGDRSYWYNNARLFRQQKKNNWYPVLEEIEQQLAILP